MKRTTYILIGLLVLGLLLVPFIFTKQKEPKTVFPIDGERAEIQMAGIRHIRIIEKREKNDNKNIEVFGKLIVEASPSSGVNVISYPKSDFLKVTQEGDHLLVEVDLDNESISQMTKKVEDGHRLILNTLNMKLKADSTLVSIDNRTSGITVNLKKISLDSLYLYNEGFQEISLDSCRFRSLDVKGNYVHLNANWVNTTNYYLDLDTYIGGEFTQFFVDNLYLTGERSHKYRPQFNCKRIFWNPKARDAELELTLYQKSEIIMKD